MQEEQKDRIIFVAGLHGNERMPVKALSADGVDFILGSPRAYERNVRFTEKDLNASFGVTDGSYEAGRALEILDRIGQNDLVVDFHTTESEKEPFVIVIDRRMLALAERTGIARVVVMTHNIKEGHALINYRNGISVEAGRHIDEESLAVTRSVVRNVRAGKKHPISVYEVYDRITEPGQYINFEAHPAGFIPVLANEPAYEKVGLFGLKARKMNT
ncbi:MAG: succinylglutamate desuccinylase/aspartoacylase family protein [bacterium]|nr:succinylglutamate desuccinylase/aspartoacylase family protein [bacterium]